MHPTLFDLSGQVVVATSGIGILTGSVADYLAVHGACVAYLGRSAAKLDVAIGRIRAAKAAMDIFTRWLTVGW